MITLIKRIERLEDAAQTNSDKGEVMQMSKADRAARLAELTPRFWAEINQVGLSTDPERRRRQERIIELTQRRDARLVQGVSQ